MLRMMAISLHPSVRFDGGETSRAVSLANCDFHRPVYIPNCLVVYVWRLCIMCVCNQNFNHNCSQMWRGARQQQVSDVAAVAVGAAIGGVLRYQLSTHRAAPPSPWAIAAINVAGSAALATLSLAAPGLSPRTRLLLGTGLCGGFTTFSTFSMDTVALLEAGKYASATALVAASNTGGIGAAWVVRKVALRR